MVKFVGVLLTSAFIVILALLIPNFDKLMSLLGALFSFIISGIFPIMCHLKLFGPSLSKGQIILNYTLIAIAFTMGVTGTLRSFL